jgi:hypothetical protein
VFPSPLRACEETGGVPYMTPEEAHHNCAGRGADSRGERRYGDSPVEATPITLPGPRGVHRGQPAPEVLPIPLPGPDTRTRHS